MIGWSDLQKGINLFVTCTLDCDFFDGKAVTNEMRKSASEMTKIHCSHEGELTSASDHECLSSLLDSGG